MSHTPPTPPRQPAYDAVYAVIRDNPPRSTDDYGQAAENARVWRAVTAALDAMEPSAHLLPLLDLTADEIAALALNARGWLQLGDDPLLRSALDKLTTTDTAEETS